MKIKFVFIAATILFATIVTSVTTLKKSIPLFDLEIEALAGVENGNTTCTVTTICRDIFGNQTGSVACQGTTCKRGITWVECDGHRTDC